MREPEIDNYLNMLEAEMHSGKSLGEALAFHGDNMTREEAARMLVFDRCPGCNLFYAEHMMTESGYCYACDLIRSKQ